MFSDESNKLETYTYITRMYFDESNKLETNKFKKYKSLRRSTYFKIYLYSFFDLQQIFLYIDYFYVYIYACMRAYVCIHYLCRK